MHSRPMILNMMFEICFVLADKYSVHTPYTCGKKGSNRRKTSSTFPDPSRKLSV